MSYQTIKGYFKRRLASFNLQEANKKLSFESESESFDNKYIIENPKTELAEGDTLATKFFPVRTFVIRTAHKTSEASLIFDYDSLQTRLENIVRDLHSVSNYRTDSIKRIVFNSLVIGQQGGYLASEMTFSVEDSLNYV